MKATSLPHYLVVVAIVNGRDFSVRSNHVILAEARFDGELLSTDPVAHDDEPQIEQELAWELDKRALQQYRLQRSSIKVIFYAQDTATTVKEAIGYVILDLRGATGNRASKWLPLLHGRYNKHKPQVNLSIYLDDQANGATLGPDGVPLPGSAFDERSLVPQLHEADGYYQIGPVAACRDDFMLSVTIANAKNLINLLPSKEELSPVGIGYFFSFNLFDNEIENEAFLDLCRSSFPAERASVRLRSSVDALRAFFQRHSQFYIYLSTGCKMRLGCCMLSLDRLFRDTPRGQPLMAPAVLEGWYSLEAQVHVKSHEEQPSVFVSVALCSQSAVPSAEQPAERPPTMLLSDNKPIKVFTTNVPKETEILLPVALPHRFTLLIELSSVRNLKLKTAPNIFLRFAYPFFGTSSPALTLPPVSIAQQQEVSLFNGNFVFEFGATTSQLMATFEAVPLLVEVFHRDYEQNNDQLLCNLKLPLGRLLEMNAVKVNPNKINEAPFLRRHLADTLPAIENMKKLVEVSFKLTLDDFGELQPLKEGVSSAVVSHFDEKQPRETKEYRAALELELWKENQKIVFEQELQTKEQLQMRTLADEWRRRDREREQLCRKKMAEYRALEDQLRNALGNLEKREHNIAQSERELERRKVELLREYELRSQEHREESLRVEADTVHRIQLETVRLQQARLDSEQAVLRLKTAQQKMQKVEADFESFRGAAESALRPETNLHAQLNLAKTERQAVESRLDAAMKAKLHYKSAWGRALKELAHAKDREQAAERDLVRRQKAELDHMRLRYLAQEENELMNKSSSNMTTTRPQLQSAVASHSKQHDSTDQVVDPARNERTARLIDERDTLLHTGVYKPTDPIIVELERQIRASSVMTMKEGDAVEKNENVEHLK